MQYRGEIFAVSAAYEVAFTASAPENKVLASATNIFCVGGIPNIISIFLYQACQDWFRNSTHGNTNISHISDYATAHVYKYFLVLMGILFFGIFINTLPSVRDFVDSIETKAAELVKTPRMTPLLRERNETSSRRRVAHGGKECIPQTIWQGTQSCQNGIHACRTFSWSQRIQGAARQVQVYSQTLQERCPHPTNPNIVPPQKTKKSGSATNLPTYNRHDSV